LEKVKDVSFYSIGQNTVNGLKKKVKLEVNFALNRRTRFNYDYNFNSSDSVLFKKEGNWGLNFRYTII
jgi:hypothetical protein